VAVGYTGYMVGVRVVPKNFEAHEALSEALKKILARSGSCLPDSVSKHTCASQYRSATAGGVMGYDATHTGSRQ
jgi:hypothetical protein